MSTPRNPRISSGVQSLDHLMGGGFMAGAINLVYGEATSGKTTLAVTTILSHLKANRASKAFIIDSDNKLNTARLTQMAESRGLGLLKRIHTYIPASFKDQEETLESLPVLEPLDIVVLDSVTGLYRGETGDETQTYQINKELNRQLGYITEVANKTGAAFILTGQVRSILDTSLIEPVATRLLGYWSSMVLKLDKTPTPGFKQVTLEKPTVKPNTIKVAITETGVTEAEI
ncbi:MAG: hypothetical protein NWE89_08845 [Candidatus Bathyarchaeota archaeon]|nr:hypothetical protein [Candidatus Bathyarchaeota archaeon]